MIKTVIKRDGRQVPFNLAKIATAILKALAQTRDSEQLRGKDDFELEALANKLAEDATRRVTIEAPDIEKIQDAVERTLMEAGYPDTAKSYILYRADRSRARERNTKLMKTLADIVFSSAKESDVKRENANIDGDTAMGSMLKFGSESSKRFYIDNMLRPDIARAHEQGDIHIHDLDFYSLTMTCCQIDLVDLLSRGFSTGHGFLRAPKEIRSFAALACIAIQSNQNDQHGGQSVPNFDLAMAMGVRLTYARRYKAALREAIELLCDPETAADIILPEPPTMGQASDPEIRAKEAEALKAAGIPEEKIPHIQDFARAHALKETDRETYQAMEALIHNLNSMHSRAGAQTPFSSINYGTDTTPEGRMVIKNVLLATQAGLGDGETPIFPIQIFRVKKGVSFDEGDPNYDLFQLACQVSAKRLFPNFAFQDAPFNAALYKEGHPETEISYMGCRTRVATNVYDPSKSQVWKRGNLSFTSINLPRLAIQSHGNIKTFYAQLDDMLQLVRDQLLERFEVPAHFAFLLHRGAQFSGALFDEMVGAAAVKDESDGRHQNDGAKRPVALEKAPHRGDAQVFEGASPDPAVEVVDAVEVRGDAPARAFGRLRHRKERRRDVARRLPADRVVRNEGPVGVERGRMHAGKARRLLEADRTKAVHELGFGLVEFLDRAGAGHGDVGVAPVDGEKQTPHGRARLYEGPVVVGVVAARGDFAHRDVDAREALLPVGRGAKPLQVVEVAVGRILFDEKDRPDRKVGARRRGRDERRQIAQPPVVEAAVKARGRKKEVDRLRADRLFEVFDEIGADREAVLRKLDAQIEKGVREGLSFGRRKARLDVADADFGKFGVRDRRLFRGPRLRERRKKDRDEESRQKTEKRAEGGHGAVPGIIRCAVPRAGPPWKT